jgi:hypothetical protein
MPKAARAGGGLLMMRKRAYLVVKGPRLPKEVSRLELAPGISAARDWPDGRPELMGGTMDTYGEHTMEPYTSPSLIVWAERPVPDSTIGAVDKELSHLMHHCDLSLAVVTRWTGSRAARLILTELWKGDERSHQGTSVLNPWFSKEGWKQEWLAVAKWPAVCAGTLELLGNYSKQNEAFMRGLRAFFRACHQDWVEDRFDLFCRSIEMVLQTDLGAGACQFAEGVLAHQGRLDREKKRHRIVAWERHYHRRNDVVHGHRWFQKKRDDRASRLIEREARRYFEDLLSNPTFFAETRELQRQRMASNEERRARRKHHLASCGKELGPLPPTPRKA